MGIYEQRVLPRVIDVLLGGAKMGKLRARAMDGLSGSVVEVGFGSGTNVPYYPAAVERVYAIDPAKLGRKLAAKRLAASTVPVEFIDLDGDRIPLEDASVDNALSTLTLCTIPDEVRALREIKRVLRPGGKLYFLEHGLSDDLMLARRQRRFDGIQQRIAGGCHLDRNHVEVLAESGFANVQASTFMIAGPKIMSFIYAGTAQKEP